MRRVLLACAVSLAVHLALVFAVVGLSAWRALDLRPAVEMVPISIESVRDLPLGPPPGASPSSSAVVEPPARPRPRPRGATHATRNGALPTPSSPDAGVAPDAAAVASGPDAGATPAPDRGSHPRARAPADLRAYGPEGSRLTAILRLDRLRASAQGRGYIGPVDEILWLLPDRRRLLEGTGLDLYRDFDALLIATPNPFDDAVTFLAARHRLDDDRLKLALDRGAAAQGRPIAWHQEGGRPVGVRRRVPAGEPPDRDDRLFVLPRPGLVVIAPPAYASLLLAHRPDGGAREDWTDLIVRIDAEDSALPENGVFMMTATNLLRRVGDRGDDAAAEVPGGGPAALPRVISVLGGTAPSSFVEVGAEFATVAQARVWEDQWPSWRQRLLGNPLVLLAGLTPIVTRAEVVREDRRMVLRTTATADEARRILQMIVNLARGGLVPVR